MSLPKYKEVPFEKLANRTSYFNMQRKDQYLQLSANSKEVSSNAVKFLPKLDFSNKKLVAGTTGAVINAYFRGNFRKQNQRYEVPSSSFNSDSNRSIDVKKLGKIQQQKQQQIDFEFIGKETDKELKVVKNYRDRRLLKKTEKVSKIFMRHKLSSNVVSSSTPLETFSKNNQESSTLFASLSRINKRPYNQDRFIALIGQSAYSRHSPSKQSLMLQNEPINADSFDIYGVFDGHGGFECSQYLKQNFGNTLLRSKAVQSDPSQALKESLVKLEYKWMQLCENSKKVLTSGSCGVVSLVSSSKVFLANVGDSRAVLLKPSKSGMAVEQLTKDHKPTDPAQKLRILKNGGKLNKEAQTVKNCSSYGRFKIFREQRIIPGNLNVSRTIGDVEAKVRKYGGLPGVISSEPEVYSLQRSKGDVLVLASDGLYDGLTNDQIAKLFSELLEKSPPGQEATSFKLLSQMAQKLYEEAEKGSGDNITILCIGL